MSTKNRARKSISRPRARRTRAPRCDRRGVCLAPPHRHASRAPPPKPAIAMTVGTARRAIAAAQCRYVGWRAAVMVSSHRSAKNPLNYQTFFCTASGSPRCAARHASAARLRRRTRHRRWRERLMRWWPARARDPERAPRSLARRERAANVPCAARKNSPARKKYFFRATDALAPLRASFARLAP